MIPTVERIRKLFDYDAESGVLRWRLILKRCSARVGDVAGGRYAQGYIQIGFDGRRYQAHRIVWLYVTGRWPLAQIDHINGNRADNRIANLREASNGQNQANAKLSPRNRTGQRGVYVRGDTGRIAAAIRVNKRHIHLGYYPSVEQAGAAYAAAALKYFGDYAARSGSHRK